MSAETRWQAAELRRLEAEEAFSRCPWWRPWREERLRRARTFARLAALDAELAYYDTLTMEERIALLRRRA